MAKGKCGLFSYSKLEVSEAISAGGDPFTKTALPQAAVTGDNGHLPQKKTKSKGKEES